MDRVTIWLERLGFLLRVLGIAGCMAGILLLTFDRQKPIPEGPDHQWIESVDADVYEGERSSEWQAVRNDFVKRHPFCAACGSIKALNVHHVEPFHLRPELELDEWNLITLCRRHHFEIGHDPDGPWKPGKPNWSKSNPLVRSHCEQYREGRRY